MALITFLSDFGDTDHYVAAVKAKILGINPNLQIIDLSHQIKPCDIAHGAYVLQAVFRDFPKGTVHIVAVNSVGNRGDKFIAARIEGHYFITTDTGLLGLISEAAETMQIDLNSVNPIQTTFPAKQIFAPAAAKLASGGTLEQLGPPLSGFKRMLGRHLKANKSLISGHVIRVDHYGNLITNIDQRTFDILSKEKAYTVNFGRESVRKINRSVNEVEAGDVFVIFNDSNLLQVGINQGRANGLLGLAYDSPVTINFND